MGHWAVSVTTLAAELRPTLQSPHESGLSQSSYVLQFCALCCFLSRKYLNTLNPFFFILLVIHFIKGKCLLFLQTESYSQNEGWLVNIILSDRNEMIEKEVQWSTSRNSNPVTSYISKAATVVPFKWALWLFGAHDINYGKCSKKRFSHLSSSTDTSEVHMICHCHMRSASFSDLNTANI